MGSDDTAAAGAFTTERCVFEAGGQTLVATKVLAAGEPEPTIVSFHGTGSGSTRERIRYLLDALAHAGLSSLCFDFSGHGESSGVMERATLRDRLTEALAACALLKSGPPLMVIGTSMGGAVATLLLPRLHPKSLVLFCPAAYPATALDLPFDDNFGAVARRPGAHAESPSYSALDAYRGDYLLIAARHDTIIPAPVIERYAEAAPRARSRRLLWLEDADHKAHRWLESHAADREMVVDAVRATAAAAGAF